MLPTSHVSFVAVVIGISVSLLSTAANAVPLYFQDVFCGTTKCGTMEITKYDTINPSSLKGAGGVDIQGAFKKTKNYVYQYVQAVTTDDMDVFRWFNDISAPLPVPYIDPPPGGYKVEEPPPGSSKYTINQETDYFPWYDGSLFPTFEDDPKVLVLRAKLQSDSTATFYAESWLVCVIKDRHDNDKQARDDNYRIAPLLGWTWGYDIVYKDVANIGMDDLADFTVKKLGFNFIMTPSPGWEKALDAKYGTRANQDFWNTSLGNCKGCIVPEPSTMLLLGAGLLGLVGIKRKFKK